VAITVGWGQRSNRNDNVGVDGSYASLMTIFESSHVPSNRDWHVVPPRNDRRLNPIVPEHIGTYTANKEKIQPY